MDVVFLALSLDQSKSQPGLGKLVVSHHVCLEQPGSNSVLVTDQKPHTAPCRWGIQNKFRRFQEFAVRPEDNPRSLCVAGDFTSGLHVRSWSRRPQDPELPLIKAPTSPPNSRPLSTHNYRHLPQHHQGRLKGVRLLGRARAGSQAHTPWLSAPPLPRRTSWPAPPLLFWAAPARRPESREGGGGGSEE